MQPRRPLLIICSLLLFSLACSGRDTPLTVRPKVIGIINLNPSLDPMISSFREELARLGHHQGDNITYLYDGALATPDRIKPAIKELQRRKVDLIFALTTPAALKAKELTRTTHTPVLFAPVFSPLESGVVESLAEPGGNVTGIRVRGSTGKALEWLLTALPAIRRIWVPLPPGEQAAILSLADLREGAHRFQVQLVTTETANQEQLTRALAAIPADVDAVWVLNSFMLSPQVEKIVAAATSRGLPVGSSTGQHRKGILLTYALDLSALGQQAGQMADKLLKGAKPREMPVETAAFFLSINLKTARAIGVRIAEDILGQADEIVR
ncbi:MAG: ABC transporter substrate-binding protein [Desulfobulbaceae bacterium]|nr:ABC transporter substrate-binding protein [Desulfobulbaceae bacterium]